MEMKSAASILAAALLAGGCIFNQGGKSGCPAPAAETTLVGFVLAHGGDANRYVDPLRLWKTRKDGTPYESTAEVMAAGGSMAETLQAIPEQLDHARVAECYRQDLYRGFVATLLWGGMPRNATYSGTLRKIAQMDRREVVAKLSRLRKLLEENRVGEAFESMTCDPETGAGNENHIDGIAENYASKILFFLTYDMPATPRPLIYNKYLAYTHCALIPDRKRRARYYSYDKAEGRLVSNIFKPDLAAEIYTDYCTSLAELASRCGANNVGIFVEWIYDWPSEPKNGDDNPRTLSFREAVEKGGPAAK